LRRRFIDAALKLTGYTHRHIKNWLQEKLENMFSEFLYQMFRGNVKSSSKRPAINISRVLKKVSWRLESSMGLELLEQFKGDLESIFNDPLRCAEEYILCSDTQIGWQRRRNLRFPHCLRVPGSYAPKDITVDDIMVKTPTTIGSLHVVKKGLALIDKIIPKYDPVTFELNIHQTGKTMSNEGYNNMIQMTMDLRISRTMIVICFFK
jgi:predicted Rdx family selenoprotein